MPITRPRLRSKAHSMQRSSSPTRRVVVAGLAVFACTGARAAPVNLPKPGPRDVCPVCGMFVAPYRYWIATILFRDGQAVHFDGAKDLFKYLTDIKRWGGGRNETDITNGRRDGLLRHAADRRPHRGLCHRLRRARSDGPRTGAARHPCRRRGVLCAITRARGSSRRPRSRPRLLAGLDEGRFE